MKVDPQHGLIEIKHGSKAYVNEPFVLAAQAAQVYHILFPSKKRRRKDWRTVYKIKSRAVHYILKEKEELQLSECFQEDETVGVHQSFDDVELDALGILLCEDGQHEEVDPIEIVLKDNLLQEEKEEEEVEEEEEEEEELEEDSKRYQISEEPDEQC